MYEVIQKPFRGNRLTKRVLCGVTAGLLLLSFISQGQAQLPQVRDGYYPMHQNMPPGMAGNWAGALGKATPNYFQPIRVELPSKGSVTVYGGRGIKPQPLSAPAMIGVGVGYTYRLRIANMPEFPGVELYPSVEVLDQLHTPAGRAAEFPVPVHILPEEIEFVLSGRMVTKVVYLEQPNLAQPGAQPNPLSVITYPANRNLIAEADRIGRPMLILRIGGRLPDARQPDPTFFGLGAPLRVLKQETASGGKVGGIPTAPVREALRGFKGEPTPRTQNIGASTEYFETPYMTTLNSTKAPTSPVFNNQPTTRLPVIFQGNRRSDQSNNEYLQSRRDDRE